MSGANDFSQTAILDRVLRSAAADWPPAAAEAMLALGFDHRDREQMSALLEMAKAGELSVEEAEALENYRRIGRLLELMKSRARRSLQSGHEAGA